MPTETQEQIQTIDKLDVGLDLTSPSNRVTWSTGRNVRFTPGFASKTPGKSLIATLPTASLPIREMFTFMDALGDMHTIACCDAHVYTLNGDFTQIAEITPLTAPTGGASDLWKFTIVAGLPLITNGKDALWKWADVSQILSPSGIPFIPKNIGCSMQRLAMSNVFDGVNYHHGRVVWSEQGNPLNLVVDTTKKGGYQDLINYQDGNASGHTIMAQFSHGSKVTLFTTQNVWQCDFSQSVKQFVIIDNNMELLSAQSACIDDDGTIYACDKIDIYSYRDGKKALGLPLKKAFFNSLNMAAIQSAFSFPMFGANEIWFCVPTGSSTVADTAYIYNWELENWTICDCDFLCHSLMYPPAAYVAWKNNSGVTDTWANSGAATLQWMSAAYASIAKDICGDSASHLLQMDSGLNALDATLTAQPINGVIETGDMALGARHIEKLTEQIFIDLAAQTQANALYIQVGVRDTLQGAIRWSQPIPFIIGISTYADIRSYGNQGAYVRFRFYTNALNAPWSFSSYAFTYSQGGLIR